MLPTLNIRPALPLTAPAEKRATSALDDALNGRVAIFTRLSLAAIDVKTMLKITELAVCIGEIL